MCHYDTVWGGGLFDNVRVITNKTVYRCAYWIVHPEAGPIESWPDRRRAEHYHDYQTRFRAAHNDFRKLEIYHYFGHGFVRIK